MDGPDLREDRLRDIESEIAGFDREVSPEDIEETLRDIAAADLTDLQVEALLQRLASQTGYRLFTLRKQLNEEQRALKQARAGFLGDDIGALIEEFNEKYCVINDGGKVLVMRWRRDPALDCEVIERIKFEDFKKMYAERFIGRHPAAEVWLRHPDRRRYLEGITMKPSGQVPDGWLNLWRGFGIEPAAGDWNLMKQHLREIVCGGSEAAYEYVLNWSARLVQQPWLAGEVAIVMRGVEGCGKGAFGRALRKLLGQHGRQITSPEHLVGKHNEHLRDCVFLFADEAFYAGDKRHESILKGLITEDQIAIEPKFLAVTFVPNMLHILMASNSEWVIRASAEARRYLMLDVLPTKRNDRAYFKALWQQMDDGGLAAMLDELLHRDISHFDVREVPQTTALGTQKALTLEHLDAWWCEVLERGYVYKSKIGNPVFSEWREFCTTELLFTSYLQWHQHHGQRSHPKPRTSLGKFMTKIAQPTKPAGENLTGEADHPRYDHPTQGAIMRSGAPGYRLGPLEEARGKFLNLNPGVEVNFHDRPQGDEAAEPDLGF